jgi:hypothetical protein
MRQALALLDGCLLPLAAILRELLAPLAQIRRCRLLPLDDLLEELLLRGEFNLHRKDAVIEGEQSDLEVPLELLLPIKQGAG